MNAQTRLLYVLAVTGAGCSIDTNAIRDNGDVVADATVDGGSDATTDAIGSDATADVAADTESGTAGDGGARTIRGTWRLQSLDVYPAGSTQATTYTDTGSPISCNGLVFITATTLSTNAGVLVDQHALLATSGTSCTTPRLLGINAFGLAGTLNEGANTFSVPATNSTLNFVWEQNNPDVLSLTLPSSTMTGPMTVVHLVRPVTLSDQATLSLPSQIDISGQYCSNTSAATHPSVTIVWENPALTPAALAGPVFPISPAPPVDAATWGYTASLSQAPPDAAMATIGGVSIAIGYIVAFDDLNENGRLDHSWLGGTSIGADTVWGVSNLAVAWRGGGTPNLAYLNSSFIDVYPGYQIVAIGADLRSNGGTAPWITPSSGVGVGAIPTDPTNPVAADGLVQVTPYTSALPRLLR